MAEKHDEVAGDVPKVKADGSPKKIPKGEAVVPPLDADAPKPVVNTDKPKDTVKDEDIVEDGAEDLSTTKADEADANPVLADTPSSSKTDASSDDAPTKTPDLRVASKTDSKATLDDDRKARLSKTFSSPGLRKTVIRVGLVAIALLAVVVTVFGVLIYAYKSQSPAVRVVAGIVPYPVERVNGRFVSYSDYLFEVDANEKAYVNNAKLNNQAAPDFKTAEGKKLLTQIKQHAIDKLKSDAVIAQLASEKKVKVTDKEVNELINQLYDRYGGKDTLLKTLNQIYGWDIDDLKRVITKQLLAKNLEDKVTADPAVDAAAKKKAQEVLAKVKGGGDFAALAKQYSQASDAASGGDLGFFTKGQLPENVQAAAEALQPDQVSDVIKTQYGYEIMKVVEKKDDGSIRGLHILIKTIDFNDYFQQQLTKAKVSTYIKV